MKQKSVKWWRYFFLLCLMGISVCMYASGGKRTLNGLVTDVEGVPVIGANILVKGQTTGVISDVEGKFSITVSSPKDVLVISYIGYNTVEMIVGEKTSINVQLTEISNLLNDVVVIGYGSMKKGEITSAITNVKSEDFIQGVVKDATQLLQGKVAGLQMASPSGDPTAGVEINIRGVSTISASSAPLIVIDGIPGGSLNSIAPEDVETIDVLKDGSAAAIYGTRGTNGVIIITTKKAKQGKASLEYHGYVAFESIQKQTDVLTASDYRRLAQDPLFKDNISDEGADVNWIDAITRNPVNHTHNLSLRGGTEKTNYIASITFQVIHAGNHIEVTGCNTEFFQKDIHFLLSAGTFFTDNDRIFHKILKGDCMILHFQIMLGYRGGNDKFILTERKKDTALIAGILSNQRQVHSAVKDAVDGLCTICLDRVKISIRVRFSVGSQDFRQQIGRRNRGCSKVDHMFLDTSEIFEKVVTNLQHAYSTVVELVTFCSDRRFFGGADDKFCMQLFLQ